MGPGLRWNGVVFGTDGNMKFGIFDHLDDSGAPLGRHFEDRLKLIEAYDKAGFYGYHLAEHHNTPLGLRAVARRLPVGRRAAHPAAQIRADGLSVAALPPAAPDRRSLHARPDVGRAVSLWRRARHLADRGRLLRRRFRHRHGAVPRGLRRHQDRPDRGRIDLSRQILRFRPCADRHEATAKAVSPNCGTAPRGPTASRGRPKRAPIS